MFLLIKKACIVKSNPRNSRNTSKYGLLCNWSWGYSTPKERSSVIYERAESNEGSTKETEAERVSYDGGSEIDCESGTSVVLLGHSSTHGLTARLKAMLRFKREPRRFGFFFFYVYQTYLFISLFPSFIYLFLCVSTPRALPLESCWMTTASTTLPPLPLFLSLLMLLQLEIKPL